MRAFWRDGAMPSCGFSERKLTVVHAARAHHLLRIDEQIHRSVEDHLLATA